MALWGAANASSNAIKYEVLAGTGKTGANTFANVTVSAFVNTVATGTFPANVGKVSGEVHAPGWVVVTLGTGPITSIAVANDGANYANLAVGGFSNGDSSASFRIIVDSGAVTDLVLLDGGAGFTNAAMAAIINPANGIAAVTIDDGGVDYAVDEVITFANGVVDATAFVSNVDANGTITEVTFTSGGRGFSNTLNTEVVIDTANGTGANLVPTISAGAGLEVTPTFGGRAGRVTYDTLAVVRGMAGGSNIPGT